MKFIFIVIWVSWLMAMIGCVEWEGESEEYAYIEVIIGENSPPIIRLGGDKEFYTPAKVEDIRVLSNEYKWFWFIEVADHSQEIPLREVIYGVVPDGFKESEKALPLEPNAKYHILVTGSFGNAEVNFTNKPDRYFGGSSEY